MEHDEEGFESTEAGTEVDTAVVATAAVEGVTTVSTGFNDCLLFSGNEIASFAFGIFRFRSSFFVFVLDAIGTSDSFDNGTPSIASFVLFSELQDRLTGNFIRLRESGSVIEVS